MAWKKVKTDITKTTLEVLGQRKRGMQTDYLGTMLISKNRAEEEAQHHLDA